jgi:high-affinity K+ transport system ATPase subunit B
VIDYRMPGTKKQRRPRSLGEELFKLAVLATAFVGYGLHGRREKGANLFFIIGGMLWICVIIAVVANRRSPVAVSKRWTYACSVCAMLSLTFFFAPFSAAYSCPHGKRWSNNLIGIAWSDNGGPCRGNDRAADSRNWHVAGNWYVYTTSRW